MYIANSKANDKDFYVVCVYLFYNFYKNIDYTLALEFGINTPLRMTRENISVKNGEDFAYILLNSNKVCVSAF